ncbi:MAG: exosortase/archaeosortase family protein [Verrucomicrobia bacterium]|nr:exosortase/archaeosortase family protein [Verrucomicrobiota bacterium]
MTAPPTTPPAADAAPSPRVCAEKSARISYGRWLLTPAAWVVYVLVELWGVLCWRLGAEWSLSEQYAYGWLVPFLALALFVLRWETRPSPEPGAEKARHRIFLGGILCLLACLPIRLFEDANPDWRLLGWLHAGVVTGLTLLVVRLIGGRPWLRHFAFPVGFFFVAVPWIKSVEEAVVQNLMHGAAALAADGLGVLGIPAQLEGNLIRLAGGATVGVNEACSGVRGLQTSLMIGLLMGELQRLTVWRRVALVGLAVALALGANVARAFFLVWLNAQHGVAAAERGHDLAGYLILGTVFVGTLALAAWLKRKQPHTETKALAVPARPASQSLQGTPPLFSHWRVWPLAGALFWLLACEVTVESWYRWHERGLMERARWTVHWPVSTPGYRELPLDEHTRRLLRFDQGSGAAFLLGRGSLADPAGVACTAYFFRWQPGRNTALLANAHRPDICLPASGWDQVADRGVRRYAAAPGLDLPMQHLEFVRNAPTDSSRFANLSAVRNLPSPATTLRAHVFYCLWEDCVLAPNAATRPPLPSSSPVAENPTATGGNSADASAAGAMDTSLAPSTRAQRWELVRTGRRHLGQQVFELALLAPLSAVDAERVFAGAIADADPARRKLRGGLSTNALSTRPGDGN